MPRPAVLFFLAVDRGVDRSGMVLAQFTFTLVPPQHRLHDLGVDQPAFSVGPDAPISWSTWVFGVSFNFRAPLGMCGSHCSVFGVADAHQVSSTPGLGKLLGWTSASLLAPWLILVAIVTTPQAAARAIC